MAIASLIGFYIEKKQLSNEGKAALIIRTLGETTREEFNFTSGTAWGLLNHNHNIRAILNDKFIECIDSICADGKYLWMFYVNNRTVNYGIKNYRLKDGDIIEFKFEQGGK